ncbi:MAG: hypothetical protein O3B44_06200 [Bacteroidetes bacterium]|nr:hypothetical protein [Bacteroidota bacterium]
MKHLLTIISCFVVLSMSAQFIPQPNAYNPDSNNDGTVGSEDLLGLLSLYGNPFNNDDSVEVVTLDWGGQEGDTLQIPESADIVYMLSGGQTGQPSHRYYLLPEGIGYKSLVLLPINQFEDWADVCFWHTTTQSFWTGYPSNGFSIEQYIDNHSMAFFVRDHFGQWRRNNVVY